MSILSKASLVQIPSGYGEDKLYSQVPNTANGDFTFTRASTGTRVNSEGFIEEVPWNLVTNSEDFTSSPYLLYAGSTAAFHPTILSPSGNLDSTLISMPNSNQAVFINNASLVSTGSTKSIYARTVSGTGKMNLLRLYNSTGYSQDNGLYDLTEEWQRFEITNDGTATNDGYFIVADRRGSGVNLTEVLVWGAQVEVGSYPTSYIPTSGTSVTRTLESGIITSATDLIGQTQGTLYSEFDLTEDNNFTFVEINLGNSTSNRILAYRNASYIQFIVQVGGVVEINNPTLVTFLDTNKIAITYQTDDFKIYLNGSLVKTYTSGNIPSGFDTIDLQDNNLNGKKQRIKSLAIFKEILTSTELATLTTI